jgi:hypothetical protein
VAMNLKVRFLPCANVVVIKLIFFYFFIFAIATAAALFLSSPPPHTHNSTPFHDVHIAACMSLNHRDWRQPHRSGRCPLLPIYAYAYFYFDLESPETIW